MVASPAYVKTFVAAYYRTDEILEAVEMAVGAGSGFPGGSPRHGEAEEISVTTAGTSDDYGFGILVDCEVVGAARGGGFDEREGRVHDYAHGLGGWRLGMEEHD